MTRIGPFLLRVDAAGKPLEVYGSSTKNAGGLYIAWRESLRRTA
jgi:hypothetical protein